MKKDIIFQTFCTTLQAPRRQMQEWVAMDLQETYYIATQTPEYIPAQNLVHIRTTDKENYTTKNASKKTEENKTLEATWPTSGR